jgi:sulfofructosephosphate aldolase
MVESMPDPLARLRRPGGAFAMLALDQREGLRTMLADRPGRAAGPVPDADLTTFKVEAARVLTGSASAVLLDVELGLRAVRAAGAIAPGCGLIVAGDRLTQAPGGPVEWTEVDDAVFDDGEIGAIADAFKLLVIWRQGEETDRSRVVTRFVAACRRVERPAIVEGIVRSADGAPLSAERHAQLVVDAGHELAMYGADVYKAEVPTLGAADDSTITAAAERLTDAIDCPWVVLSNGTPASRYGTAMLAACRGGADGFLAGRAIWTDSIAAGDTAEHLAAVARPRLEELAGGVDAVVAARRSR